MNAIATNNINVNAIYNIIINANNIVTIKFNLAMKKLIMLRNAAPFGVWLAAAQLQLGPAA